MTDQESTTQKNIATLAVKSVSVFMQKAGYREEVTIVRDIDLDLAAGEIHALVGESGSGKTITSLAIMGLLDPKRSRITGSIQLDGAELLGMDERNLVHIRGARIAMIFQEPAKYLNPSRKIGSQIEETVRLHRPELKRNGLRDLVVQLLLDVGLNETARVQEAYPHELSGGMCQRVMIAQALAGNPEILIADEPTTALDANHRAGIELLIREQAKRRGIAVLFISHDLRSVARIADRVSVMYAGRIVERMTNDDFKERPQHPYTRLLRLAIPDAASRGSALQVIPGTVPEPGNIPRGCAFSERCPWREETCAASVPPLTASGADRFAACHRLEELWQYW